MTGRSDEMKGALKKSVGRLAGDDALETEGATRQKATETARKVVGAVKESKGTIKGAVGNAINSPTIQAERTADRLRDEAERR